MAPQRSGPLPNYSDYVEMVGETNKLPKDNLRPVLFGLFGEVGGLMVILKKVSREEKAYDKEAVTEELGDILWYFTAFCQRIEYRIDHIFSSHQVCELAARNFPFGDQSAEEDTTIQLGRVAANLLQIEIGPVAGEHRPWLLAFEKIYLQTVHTFGILLSDIVTKNQKKTCGRFSELDFAKLPNFDEEFPGDEQLPKNFEIKFIQRACGKSQLQWNGVFIGDALVDGISGTDDFRFHDVFHLAHAAILHWSPVFRALIKHKRKSIKKVDENEDGGRAIIVEEALILWVFSCAKEQDLFKFQEMLSFDLLKTVQQFVRGYEVEVCSLKLWEYAILEGYKVFRSICDNKGGIVIGNRAERTLVYKPIPRGDNHEPTPNYPESQEA